VNEPTSTPTPRRRPRRAGWAVRALALVALAYVAWCGLLFVAQTSLVYPRQLAGKPFPADVAIAGEKWFVDIAPGQRVEAWYFPVRGASAERPVGVAIFFHGNAEFIDHYRGEMIRRWHARGFSVLLPEYRGYGRSDGTPSQAGILADALAFYDRLVARPEVDKARIILHGRSLGTGVAAQVGAVRPAAALVLDSPFTSIAAFAARYLVPEFVVTSPFRTDRVLPAIAARGAKVLILHSPTDEIVPYDHGKELAAITPGAVLVDLVGSHIEPQFEKDSYWVAVDALLARLR
jgi:fermentation-respiration switch protein FrsA (DUF1100 family)